MAGAAGRKALTAGSAGDEMRTAMEDSNIVYPQGMKWTKQRKGVYRVLWEAQEPLSAIQIYNLVEKQADGEEYAVSTIYRILAAFDEKAFVTKTNWMGDGTVVYELNRGEHTHYAVCLECHKRIALQNCPFAHIHLDKEAGDFTITGHKLELYGYCKDCKKRAKKDEKTTKIQENKKN